MDAQTARQLNRLNGAFYARASASFSETRNSAWEGWRRVLDELPDVRGEALFLLDIACGNLRFERFLSEEHIAFEAWCVDGCPDLMQLGCAGIGAANCHLQHLDVGEVLLCDGGLPLALEAPLCDVAVVFGFMHHLPMFGQRQGLMEACVEQLRPGGMAVLSFWQFAKSEKLRAKAEQTTSLACDELGLTGLGEGDYLLGWQQTSGLYRYCHHFTEDEIDELVHACSAQEIKRFSADGKTHDLNRYVVLRKEK